MTNEKKFASLLKAAIKKIKKSKSKSIGVIQDELGYACGREAAGSYISYLGQGHIPSSKEDLEILAKELMKQGGITKEQLEEFLIAGGHPYPKGVINSPQIDQPQRVEYFTGRETEIKELLASLQPSRMLTLCGPGGFGKSALVAEAIHRLAPGGQIPEQFPHGLFYHDFYREPSVDATIEQIARFFEEELKPTPYLAARRALFTKQALLVFDGAEEADNLNKVLEIRGKCGILLVTRDRSAIKGKAIIVDVLPIKHSINILQAWSAHKEPTTPEFQVWSDDQEGNWKIAEQICELVGRLPLALRLAGNYMRTSKIKASQYLPILEETPLATLKGSKDLQHESVPILLKKSLEKISEHSPKVIEVMAIIGLLAYAPFTSEVIADALGLSNNLTIVLLNEFMRFGMVKKDTDESYQVVHRLIHAYAQEQLLPSTEVIVKLTTYYTTFVNVNQGRFNLLNGIRPHIMALLSSCRTREVWEVANALIVAITEYLEFQGYWTDLLIAYEIGLAGGQALKDRLKEGLYLIGLAQIYYGLGQINQAMVRYQQALAILTEITDRNGEMECLKGIGSVHRILGRYQQALTYFHQALVIAQALGDRASEGTCLGNLGHIHECLEQHQQAIAYYQQALIIAREIGDKPGEGIWLDSLGVPYFSQGQYQQAIAYYQQALTIAQEIGRKDSERGSLVNLGTAYGSLGEMDLALVCFQAGLSIAQAIGSREGEGTCLSNLGLLHIHLGDYQQAIAYCQQALAIAQETGDRKNEAISLGNLGSAYHALEQYQKAIECYEQVVTIDREISNRTGEMHCLDAMGDIYQTLNQAEQAIAHYQQALTIAQEFGDLQCEEGLLGNLGKAYANLKQYQKAVECWQQAFIVAQKLDDNERVKEWSYILSYVYCFLDFPGHFKEAIQFYEKAIQLDPMNLWICTKLADSYLNLTQMDKAAHIYQRCIEICPNEAFHALVNLGIIAWVQGNEIEAQNYFEKALPLSREMELSSNTGCPAQLLQDKALTLLCLGQEELAIFILEQVVDQLRPIDTVLLICYDLLAKAPNPPQGLDKLHSLLKEAIEKTRSTIK